MATVETVRQALAARPFRRFSLRLIDGTVYDVDHPGFLAIPPLRRPRELICFVVSRGEDESYETQYVDLGLVSEVIVPATSPEAAAGGSGA